MRAGQACSFNGRTRVRQLRRWETRREHVRLSHGRCVVRADERVQVSHGVGQVEHRLLREGGGIIIQKNVVMTKFIGQR